MIFHVGFTGTQKGMTEQQKTALRQLLKDFYINGARWFHHGVYIGSDVEAHWIALELNYFIMGHPPLNQSKMAHHVNFDKKDTPRDYLSRNRVIVRKTEVLIATPAQYEEVLRSGTWSTVRYARKLFRPTHIILPNGMIVK